MTDRRQAGQRGASLIMVLALMAFLAVIVPAILGLVALGPRITKPVVEDRRELYAASSAIEAAIELGRTNPDVGVPGGPCPAQILEIDRLEATVRCERHAFPDDGCHYLDRFATFTAEVREPGQSAVIARTSAEVVFRFHLNAPATAEVRQWNPSASQAVSTTALPDCSTVSTTTVSTTTTSTASTTTTTASTTTVPPTTVVHPGASILTRWLAPSYTISGSNWRADGPMEVTDDLGLPLVGAEVRIAVEYRPVGSTTWVRDADIEGTSIETGSVTFHSAPYRRNGPTQVVEVRFTVVDVVHPGLVWQSAANPVSVPITGP